MKRNHLKKKNAKNSPLANTQERLNEFQTQYPYKFRQVFDNFHKGQQELSNKLVEEAKKSFEKALTIYPDYIPALNQLAVIYGFLKDNKEVTKIVKKVIVLDDKNVFAFIQGAISLYRQGQEKEAGLYAKKALASFHVREGHDSYQDYDMLQKLVEMLSVLRLDSILINLYEQRKNQLSPRAHYLVALSLSNEQSYHEARAVLQKIHDGTPIKDKADQLDKCLELSIDKDLEVPKLIAEDETTLKNVTAILEKYGEKSIELKPAKFNNGSMKEGQAYISSEMGISELLDRYTKDKLVSIVKFYKIRGYSKLNKKNLIQLIVEEIYSKKLWKASMNLNEQKCYDELVENGASLTEKDLNEFFEKDTKQFLKEIVSDTSFEEMKSTFGKLLARGILFVGVNKEKQWQIQIIN